MLLHLHRYIFWNAGGLGWSIGKREYLKSGTHWHKSNAITGSYNWLYISLFLGGSDDTEPWTSKWLGGVVVKCAEKAGKKYQLSFKALFPFGV